MFRLGVLQTKRIFDRFSINTCKSIIWKRFQNTDPEDGKTTVQMLNNQFDIGIMIDAISTAGFRLNNGFFAVGPIIVFPQSVLSWNVKDVESINKDSLSLLYILEPKLDILVIGFGDKGNKLDPALLTFLTHEKKIFLEVLPTEQATSTYNFLLSERRFVAAALFPPISMAIAAEDIITTSAKKKELFEISDWDK